MADHSTNQDYVPGRSGVSVEGSFGAPDGDRECCRERNQLLCDLARACLEATGMFRSSDVHLEVRSDELVLCGTVASWYEKQLAQETLREVSDAVAIRNLIDVRPRLVTTNGTRTLRVPARAT